MLAWACWVRGSQDSLHVDSFHWFQQKPGPLTGQDGCALSPVTSYCSGQIYLLRQAGRRGTNALWP